MVYIPSHVFVAYAVDNQISAEQTKVRSKIRLLEGREKPVDLLAKNIILIEYFDRNDKV